MKNYLNFFRYSDKLEICVFTVLTIFVIVFAVLSILQASQGNILCIWYLLWFVFALEDREKLITIIKLHNRAIDEEYENIENSKQKYEYIAIADERCASILTGGNWGNAHFAEQYQGFDLARGRYEINPVTQERRYY